jgi:Na+:H+ antiporter, NhaA family
VTKNSLGIMLGLIVGAFLGIFVPSYLAVKLKLANLSEGLNWEHIAGIALLGGIGFTMSIFIINLAFDDTTVITASKTSVLLASFISAVVAF